MATVSDRQADPLAVRPWPVQAADASKSEHYLSRRFGAAISDFRGMALATFLLGFGLAAIVWVFAGVLLEHWVLPGGLPVWGRWAWLGVAGLATVAAAARWLAPLFLYRVNLLYAARAIERAHPELHNDLVNAVLVRQRPGDEAEAVVKSLRRRAARQLSKVPDDGVVDRTPVARLAWGMAAVFCVACVYQLLAPKSLLVSAARLITPWSGITAPSRVRIEPPRLSWRLPGEDPARADDASRSIGVVRGDADLIRGRQLVVTTAIEGLVAGEQPVVIVTPLRDDGSLDADPWRMPLKTGRGRSRTVVIPGDDRPLDRPIELVVAAGDARSERIRVRLADAPTLTVREIRYDYPPHINRDPETLSGQGDIRGVEGTRVTIVAASNKPLAEASIDFDCDWRRKKDGLRDVSLSPQGPDQAVFKGTFELRLAADRRGPEYGSYRFVYRPKSTAADREAADVVGQLEHRIEVIPDLAPEVSIEAPSEKMLSVPPDAPVTVRVRAVDPDYGLTSVRVDTRLAGGAIREGRELLPGGARGRVTVAETIVPATLGAAGGGTLEYRAVAVDNRPEHPNETATEWQALRIDASAPPPSSAGRERADRPTRSDSGRGVGDDGRQAEAGQDDRKGTGSERQPGASDPSRDEQGGSSQAADGQSRAGRDEGDEPSERGGRREQRRQPGDEQRPDPERDPSQGQPQSGTQGQQGQPDASKQGDQQGEQRGSEGQQPADQRGDNEGQKGRDGGSPGQSGTRQGGRQGDQSGDGDGGRDRGNGQGGGQGDQAAGRSGRQDGGAEGRIGERQRGENGGQGERRPDPAVAADGTNDGEAIERILENRRREGASDRSGNNEGESGQSAEQGEAGRQDGREAGRRGDRERREGEAGSQGQGEPGGGQSGQRQDQAAQAGGRSSSGEGRRDDGDRDGESRQDVGQDGGRPPASEPEAGSGSPPSAPGEESAQSRSSCQGGEGEPCGKSGCPSCSGGGKSGAASGPGQGQPGQGQPGQGQPGQGQPGQGQPGQGQPGQGQPGQGQPGQGQSGQGQPGQGQPGQGQPGQGQPGQGQPGQGQPGQGQSGQGQPGQGQSGQGVEPGGQGGQGGAGEPPAARSEMEWGRQNLEHARNATDLAVDHLRDSLANGRTEVLDELGWTPEQARAFLDRWRTMQRLARSDDPRERAEFERTVRSLGLRPDGVRSSRDLRSDVRGGQAEGRRSRPPGDYREQFKAFMQGTGGP